MTGHRASTPERPRSRFEPGALVVVLLCALACATEPRVGASGGRQVVRFELPRSVEDAGRRSAPILLVEFGSFACEQCRQFARDVFPVIQRRYIDGGRLRYRYVDLSPEGPPTDAALIANCLGPRSGFGAARAWSHDIFRYGDFDAARVAAAVNFHVDVDSLRACTEATRRSVHRAAERVVAESLGVLGTPTFVVGIEDRGRVTGWAFVGLTSADVLGDAIERASAAAQ